MHRVSSDARRRLGRGGARWGLPALLALACLLPGAAAATEGGFVAGPVGGSDIRAALLPPPGNYLLGLAFYGAAVDFRDRDGARSFLAPRGEEAGFSPGFGRVFEGKILGGHIAADAMVPIGQVCLRLTGVGRSQCKTGFGDIYAELFWSRPIGELGLPGPPADDPRRRTIPYGLTVGAGFGAVLPTGSYSRTDVAPLGLNTLVLLPNVAATWISPTLLLDGTEISVRAFYAIHGRNDATRYQAGDMVVLDWAISERFGRWQLGPAGSYARQLEPDRAGGQRGPATSVTAIGAVLAMDLPEYGAFLSLKYIRDVEATYRLRLERVGLRIGVRL